MNEHKQLINNKVKIIIKSSLNFEDGLKAELEQYKKRGVLEDYGENGVVLSKSYKKACPGDIVAIYSRDGYIIYCKIKTVFTLEDKSQMVNMNYVDFVKISVRL